MTLQEYARDRHAVVLWWTSTEMYLGAYTGLGIAGNDFAEDRDLYELEGTVTEGIWDWDGCGRPTDPNGNAIRMLRAYSDKTRWDEVTTDA